MQRPIAPRWLLRQADELGGRHAGTGQPRNADLRRSASNAYYAVFHALALALVDRLLPTWPDSERLPLTRSLRHDGAARVCEWLRGGGPAKPQYERLAARLRSEAPIRTVAATLGALRAARHEADYDHLADFDRNRALVLVDLAREAVDIVEAERETPAFHAFLALLALGS